MKGNPDSPPGTRSSSERLRLKAGISKSQARFALSNFCLDQFGTAGQPLAEVVDLCTAVDTLQQALESIRLEVGKRCPDKLPALVACVAEINESDF